MAFQPVVDVQRREIYAYEALVRGINGEGAGQVLAEVSLENLYAFDQCCRVRAIELAARLKMTKRLNINFMPNAVYHPQACLKKTIETATACDFPVDLITFEFTENEQIVDRAHLKSIIETYRKNNFVTAIDDFGAGFSGLSLLADFQPDVIKIDREIITGIDQSIPRQAILKGTVEMAKIMNLRVVAEGVERAEEYRFLKEAGVRFMQGYVFAKPAFECLISDAEINWP